MRRKEKEITDSAEIEDIIKKAEVLHLAMIDGDEPYVVPVNYAYMDGCLVFHSAYEGRKIDVLKANPKVCFTLYTDHNVVRADKACEFTNHYRCVIGSGHAEFLTDVDEKIKCFSKLIEHYAPGGPVDFHEKLVEITNIIKIHIDSMTGKKSGG